MADHGADPYQEGSTPHSRRGRRCRRQPPPPPPAPVPVGSFTAAASGLPATDAGANPSAATAHPPVEPNHESLEQPMEQTRDSRLLAKRGEKKRCSRRLYFFLEGRYLGPMTYDEFVSSEGPRIAARSRPSSSAAPRSKHLEEDGDESSISMSYRQLLRGQSVSGSAGFPSDHSGAERTGSRTHLRQSVLYSDRLRWSRRRRPIEHVEHPSERSSSKLEVTNLTAFEALSVRDSSTAFPSEIEEHPSEASSELSRARTDLPTLEALSLSEPPLFTPQTAEESDSDDDVHVYDDDALHEPIEFGIGSFDPQSLCYSPPRPRFKWSEGIRERGQATLEELAAVRSSAELGPLRSEVVSGNDSSFSPKSTEKNSTKDSDDDMEEELRLIREYRAAHTVTSVRQFFDEILASQHELAAKKGIKLPPPRPAKHLPIQQETQSLQARQESSSAAAQPQHNTAPEKSRSEASKEELAENADSWMREEVKMVFEKYIEKREDLKELDCRFGELCHQCFNVENSNKLFHHYNFTVRMKKPNSVDWVVALYFAEVKQIFGRKYYFCCRLEPNENGHCYACKSQGVEDLQHPATGGFERGSPNVGFGLWYE